MEALTLTCATLMATHNLIRSDRYYYVIEKLKECRAALKQSDVTITITECGLRVVSTVGTCMGEMRGERTERKRKTFNHLASGSCIQ